MSMTATARQTLLSSWIKPSSANEKLQQDRAERMVCDAISAHPPFEDTNIKVYSKGSYPNNTNVRLDSDVDVVVENQDCLYSDFFGDYQHPPRPGEPYEGPWLPQPWRSEVTAAIVNRAGAVDVDTSGSIAVVVAAKPGSRPSIDIVPSYPYVRYDTPDRRTLHTGSKVFKKSSGSIVNWPQQQLDQGRAKNNATGQRYKNYIRALKNAENYLVEQGVITAKASYLMECLVWNVPNDILRGGSLDDGFRGTLVWLWQHLADDYEYEDWAEPNQLKYLFHTLQNWTVQDAKDVVLETWQLLDY